MSVKSHWRTSCTHIDFPHVSRVRSVCSVLFTIFVIAISRTILRCDGTVSRASYFYRSRTPLYSLFFHIAWLLCIACFSSLFASLFLILPVSLFSVRHSSILFKLHTYLNRISYVRPLNCSRKTLFSISTFRIYHCFCCFSSLFFHLFIRFLVENCFSFARFYKKISAYEMSFPIDFPRSFDFQFTLFNFSRTY